MIYKMIDTKNDNQYGINNDIKTIIKQDTILFVKYDTIIKNIPYKNKKYTINPNKTKLNDNIHQKLDTILNKDTLRFEYTEMDNLMKLDIKYHKDTFRVINKESMEIRTIEEKTTETITNNLDKTKPKDNNIFENIETMIFTMGLGFIFGILFN